jgi:hypothetical protein
VFKEEGFTAYFDLGKLLLFIQGPSWKYSWSGSFYREPTLATPEFVNYVLIAGGDESRVAVDGSEKRDCLMWKWASNNPLTVIQMLPVDLHYHAYYCVPRYLPKKEWELAIEGCKMILQQDSWEQLFEALCKPNYDECTIDKTWMHLINNCHKIEYRYLGITVSYFVDWVVGVLEEEEGITSHYIE